MGLGQGVLQSRWDRLGQWTGLCPAEPVHLSQSGTTRPCNFSLPPQGDHACMQKAHGSRLRPPSCHGCLHTIGPQDRLICARHHRVSTTAAASNKQGDVELVIFGLVGSNKLVIDVSICCDHIGNSTVKNGPTARCTPMTICRPVLGSTKRITLPLVRRLHLELCPCQWPRLDKFIPSFSSSVGLG